MNHLMKIVICLGITACASPEQLVWKHPTKNANDFITDEAKCSAGSMLMPRTTQLSAMQYQLDQKTYINTCLKSEGWRN